MKRSLLITISTLLLLGCSSEKTTELASYKDATIKYEAKTAQYYGNNRLKKCKLTDTARLADYYCIGTLQLFENGRIKQFETAKEFKFDDNTVPANSIIIFDDENKSVVKYVCLGRDCTLNNIECKGGSANSVEFNFGKLAACYLTKDQDIQGFPCAANGKPVYFYADGKPRIFTLAKEFVYSGQTFKKGEILMVETSGKVGRLQDQASKVTKS